MNRMEVQGGNTLRVRQNKRKRSESRVNVPTEPQMHTPRGLNKVSTTNTEYQSADSVISKRGRPRKQSTAFKIPEEDSVYPTFDLICPRLPNYNGRNNPFHSNFGKWANPPYLEYLMDSDGKVLGRRYSFPKGSTPAIVVGSGLLKPQQSTKEETPETKSTKRVNRYKSVAF